MNVLSAGFVCGDLVLATAINPALVASSGERRFYLLRPRRSTQYLK